MKRAIHVVIAGLCMSIILLSGCVANQPEEFVLTGETETPEDAPLQPRRRDQIGGTVFKDLQASLWPNRVKIKEGEPFSVEVRIKNISPLKDISFYNELMPEGWLMRFQITRDNEIVYSSEKNIPANRSLSKHSHYAVLPPGAFVGRNYLIEGDTPFTPGKYRITAIYENHYELSLASMKFTDKEISELGKMAFVGVWVGTLFSNAITVEVTPR